MSEVTETADRCGSDGLAACCQRVVEAQAGDDPRHLGAALTALYTHLTARGWTPPPRARLLVRLQEAEVEAALERLLVAHGDGPPGPRP